MTAKVTILPMSEGRKVRARDGLHTVNTTSRGIDWEKGLSPFYLGPCKLYGKYTATRMENGWQYTKVYEEYLVHSDDPRPSQKYWEWAKKGWVADRAVRYPMGRGRKPVYSLWDGDTLSYVEARKRIYVPLYKKAVTKTAAWKTLKGLYRKSDELILLDFDGYNHHVLGKSLTEVLNDPNRKMGHAFVLAMLLTDDEALSQCE